jgi:LPS-assembly protein
MLPRYAMLVVALVAAADALAQVRVMPGLPGAAQSSGAAAPKEPMTVDAEHIEGVGSLEIGARGAAEIAQDELNIFGETLRLNQEFGTVDGDGGVRLKSGVDRFFGPRLRYNMLDDTGVFEQPQFLLRRDLPARGTAESMEFLGKDKYRFKNATFTTCEPGNDDWMIEAKELTLDYTTQEGEAKSPRLRFYDVPILGAPFVTFPLENSRKSGLLTPYYAHSSTRGFEAGIPYYWNIAPEYDATITPSYMTKRGLFLRNEGRYLNPAYRGDLRLEYMPEDTQLRRERHGVSWNHVQTLAPGMGLNVDFNRVSDDRYFVDLTSQVRQSSIGNLQQDAYVTYGGNLGTAPYSAQVRVQRFQTLQDPLAPIVPPYHRVPQLNFATSVNNIGGVLDTNWPVEYARFVHSSLQQGTRVSASPVVTAPWLSPGAFFTPKAGLRYVGYNLQDAPPGSSGRPAAAIPWMSIDTGLVFDRDTRFFGENLTQTLEPRLFYVNIPFRNQDTMPLFDTALADFNFPQLFTENRFNGGDRFGDANQLTSAITSRFLSAGGQEAFRATIGQINYFRDERVGLTPTSTLRTFHTSDLLASLGGRPLRSWTFDTTLQYNRRDSSPQRYTVATRYSPETAKVLSASYRFNQDPANPIKQVDFSGQWPVAPGWYAVGRYNYSLLDKRLVDGIGGLEYNAGCWVFRAVFQRIQAAAQVSSTAFFFQLEFTGVGQIGTDEVITLLKRNVSGYSITNPRDPTFAPPSARKPLPFEQVF